MWHPKAKFPEELKTQSKEARIEYFYDGFILDHKKLNDVLEILNKQLLDSKKYPIIKITGPTGVGKTALCLDSLTTIYKRCAVSANKGELPGVYVEVPKFGDAKKFSWKAFYEELLESLTHPGIRFLKEIKIKDEQEGVDAIRVFSKKNLSEGRLRKLLKMRLKELNVKVIILDEIQHMFDYTEANVKDNLDVIKSLANITEVQFILVGTYEGIEKISLNGRMGRRRRNIHYTNYDLSTSTKQKKADPDEYQSFFEAYSGLLAHVPFELHEDLLSDENVDEVYIRCAGCIGILKEMIERALDSMSKNQLLTPKMLFEHSIDADDIETIWDEITLGRMNFERNTFDDIRKQLGKGKKKTKKKKTNSRPGVRNPKRDPT